MLCAHAHTGPRKGSGPQRRAPGDLTTLSRGHAHSAAAAAAEQKGPRRHQGAPQHPSACTGGWAPRGYPCMQRARRAAHALGHPQHSTAHCSAQAWLHMTAGKGTQQAVRAAQQAVWQRPCLHASSPPTPTRLAAARQLAYFWQFQLGSSIAQPQPAGPTHAFSPCSTEHRARCGWRHPPVARAELTDVRRIHRLQALPAQGAGSAAGCQHASRQGSVPHSCPSPAQQGAWHASRRSSTQASRLGSQHCNVRIGWGCAFSHLQATLVHILMHRHTPHEYLLPCWRYSLPATLLLGKACLFGCCC